MNDSEYKTAKKNALKEFISRYDYWRDARDCPELPPLFYPQKPKKAPKIYPKVNHFSPKNRLKKRPQFNHGGKYMVLSKN